MAFPRYRAVVVCALALTAAAWGCSGDDDGMTNPDPQTGTVAGSVIDGDGGAGLNNVGVSLSRAGSATRNATTNASGDYQFNDVPTGTWTLVVDPPAGYVVQAGQTHPVQVTVVDDMTTTVGDITLEQAPSGTVTATVTADDAPLPGATVRLFTAAGAFQSIQTTNASGVATFGGVLPGNYDVRLAVPTGYELAPGEVDEKPVTVVADQTEAVTFELVDVPDPDIEEVHLSGTVFSPSSLTIAPGTIVRWINDGGSHTITPENSSQPGVWTGTSTSTTGLALQHQFNTPDQTYDYFCIPHESLGMTGTITVTP